MVGGWQRGWAVVAVGGGLLVPGGAASGGEATEEWQCSQVVPSLSAEDIAVDESTGNAVAVSPTGALWLVDETLEPRVLSLLPPYGYLVEVSQGTGQAVVS